MNVETRVTQEKDQRGTISYAYETKWSPRGFKREVGRDHNIPVCAGQRSKMRVHAVTSPVRLAPLE